MQSPHPIAAGEAFEPLRNAIRRHEGCILVTGDAGTGKTSVCRALHEQIDPKTFTALVLNPPSSGEDLLKKILQEFGAVSREDVKSGCLDRATMPALLLTLHNFLLGLVPLEATAALIVDEAQSLPLQVLEQIRALATLEIEGRPLLQIVLAGEPDLQTRLQTRLRSSALQQLDDRVSIRYELQPRAGTNVSAECAPAGKVRRMSRARWLRLRASLAAASVVVLLAATSAVGVSAWLYERYGTGTVMASERSSRSDIVLPPMPKAQIAAAADTRDLPADTRATILAGSYPADSSDEGVVSLTRWLEASGYRVYYAPVDLGAAGRWRRVLAGAYADRDRAAADAERLNRAAPGLGAQAVAAAIATGSRVQR